MSDVNTWDQSAGGNDSAPPNGWPEGMAPSALNDCGREVMAAVARWYAEVQAEPVSASLSTTQTFALSDQKTIQILTGSTGRTWTIPTNASVDFGGNGIFAVHAGDTAAITISPASGVTLTSILGSGNDDILVLPGGTALIFETTTNEWAIVGDIFPA